MTLKFGRCLVVSLALLFVALLLVALPAHADKPADEDAIDVLLITNGCCHNYDFQSKALQLAFEQRGVAVNWTVVNEGGSAKAAEIEFYNDPDWGKGFDVVIHNECFAKTVNPEYIRKITKPHFAGVNAVVIHCAMHTYRDAEIDDWREFLGVTSRRHDHQSHYTVNVVKHDHAIMKDYPDGHKTAMDELYIIEKTWPNTVVLATSKSEKDGQEHPVFWTNQYGKARVFGTTYGHSDATFEDEIFLNTIVQGATWAAANKVAK